MIKKTAAAAALALACLGAGAAPLAAHVLMLSFDGLHAQDLARCIERARCPNLAALAAHGLVYRHASTPGLSDSVPGLAALVSGGSPRSTGLFYDDVYDRSLYAGSDTDCRGPRGVEVLLTEVVGIDARDGGALAHLDGGGAFNPQQIPRRRVGADCVAVHPHDFIRTNTVFEVVKQHLARSRTAWADKHAWGTDWINGPSGKGVDDLARTEINSIDGATGHDYTESADGRAPAYLHTEVFDEFHVRALLNEIDGRDSGGAQPAPVPSVFGADFQTLSVAQKAPHAAGGGYADADFRPGPFVSGAIAYLDDAVGRITAELVRRGLADSTLVIVTAKHGQSPADPARLRKLGHAVTRVLAPFLGKGRDPASGNDLGGGHVIDDDVAFVWLEDPRQRAAAVAALRAAGACPAVDPRTHLAAPANALICTDGGGAVIDLGRAPQRFGNPADGRTPDIMVRPAPGVIYTRSLGKDMEHGGFAPDDAHVALLVSMPGFAQREVEAPVLTTQVAPTLLRALGLDPRLLHAVRKEGTPVLPFVLGGARSRGKG
ncbi:MAG: alkaline phosphatase family protein [Burkholderiales bacterium]|nr:alkaline phosphatase family protein [Burkholderiales bacterium]